MIYLMFIWLFLCIGSFLFCAGALISGFIDMFRPKVNSRFNIAVEEFLFVVIVAGSLVQSIVYTVDSLRLIL